MSEAEDSPLFAAAEDITDGREVDWGARRAAHPGLGRRLERLAAIAGLASAQRRAAEPAAVTPSPELFRWGPLVVLERLGGGAFGEVFRAWDPRLQREVALKLLRAGPDLGAGHGRQLAEARRLARVRHPNVLVVHGADVHRERVGLWTDLVRGRTLERWLAEHGRMSAREAALIGLDLLRALAAVHGAGLVHGDVKAANVMREGTAEGSAPGSGRIVLADFGAVTEAAAGPAAGLDPAVGTPLSVAPEVLLGETPSVASDLYALGVLLYRLVSGRHPVEAATLEALAEKHHRLERVPLRDARADLPADFVAVVERALSVDPRARFASAGAMEGALAATLASSPGAREGAASPDAARPRRLRRAAWVAGAAVLVLGLAGAWLAARAPREAEDGPQASSIAARPADRAEPGASPSAPPASAEVGAREGVPSAAGRASAPAPRLEPPRVEAALFRVSGGGAEPLASGARLRPGDQLYLELRGREPLHVYVLNEDGEGRTYSLFPLAGVEPANPLAADVTHRLPGRAGGAAVEWQVTTPGGRETFLAVASRAPLLALEREIARLEPARAGRQVAYAELDEAALGTLRGVGGLASGRAPPAPGGSGRVAELARRIAATSSTQLWVRLYEFENPSP